MSENLVEKRTRKDTVLLGSCGLKVFFISNQYIHFTLLQLNNKMSVSHEVIELYDYFNFRFCAR